MFLASTPRSTSPPKLWRESSWQDHEVERSGARDSQPGREAPATQIIVVHRSDGSGTTYIWTDYLSKVSKEWETKAGRGTSVNWPAGLGGKGNEGVSGQVQQTPNSIGYVELIYAVQNKMKTGKVKNLAGTFVEASLAGVTAAAASSKEMPDDFGSPSPTLLVKTPIDLQLHLAADSRKDSRPHQEKGHQGFSDVDAGRRPEDDGVLAYAPLPKAVVAKEQKAIAKIQ